MSDSRLEWEYDCEGGWEAASEILIGSHTKYRGRWSIAVGSDGVFSIEYTSKELLSDEDRKKTFLTFESAKAFCEAQEERLLVARESAVGE